MTDYNLLKEVNRKDAHNGSLKQRESLRKRIKNINRIVIVISSHLESFLMR
jgi:hypothetical protein